MDDLKKNEQGGAPAGNEGNADLCSISMFGCGFMVIS
jgi:hypothetical protein